MTADQRRRAVTFLRTSRRASLARACRLVGIGRSSYASTSRRAGRDAPVRARLRVLAGERPRWGAPRPHWLLVAVHRGFLHLACALICFNYLQRL